MLTFLLSLKVVGKATQLKVTYRILNVHDGVHNMELLDV